MSLLHVMACKSMREAVDEYKDMLVAGGMKLSLCCCHEDEVHARINKREKARKAIPFASGVWCRLARSKKWSKMRSPVGTDTSLEAPAVAVGYRKIIISVSLHWKLKWLSI